jgi:hypothetical protein
MTPTIIAYHGAALALNFDYAAFREAVSEWKGTRTYRNAAEAAGITSMCLYRFLAKDSLISWDNAQRLLGAMRRDAGEFVR